MKRLFILFFMSQLVLFAWADDDSVGMQHTRQLIQSVAISQLTPGDIRAALRHQPGTEQTGVITGQLYNLDDEAWESAYVKAFTADSLIGGPDQFEWVVPVEPDGHYRIDGVPEGSYYVFAVAKGYQAVFYPDVTDISEAKLLQVDEGQEITGIDFRMRILQPAKGAIAGQIRDKETGDPLSNVSISVFSSDGASRHGFATSDREGKYRVSDLSSGSYYVSAWSKDYIHEFYDGVNNQAQATLVQVSDPDTTREIDFSLTLGGVISGFVTDNEGNPLADVYMLATAFPDSTLANPEDFIWNAYGKAVTDESGRYKIKGLPGADYYVLAESHTPYGQAFRWYENALTQSDATPITLAVGEQVTDIDFQMPLDQPDGFIAGHVTSTDGHPIEGASIRVQSYESFPGDPYYWQETKTNDDGYYIVKNLMSGCPYLVSVWILNGNQKIHRWWPDSKDRVMAEPVIVGAPDHPENIDFRLTIDRQSASISGQVLDLNDQPLADARVQVSPAPVSSDSSVSTEIWASGYTDKEGVYRIDNLPAGHYRVHAQHWQDNAFGEQWYDQVDDPEKATLVTLSKDEQRTGVDFNLDVRPRYGAIVGQVLDQESGVPLERCYVQIQVQGESESTNASFAPRMWNRFAVTDANGRFNVDWLYEGEYLVSVYANKGFTFYEQGIVPDQATPVTVNGGERTEITVNMPLETVGSGVITGTVQSVMTDLVFEPFSPLPYDIAIVIARPAITILSWPESARFYCAVVNPDGSYELAGLPAGEYYIMSFAPWSVAKYYDDSYDPAKATLVKVGDGETVPGIDFHLDPIRWLELDQRMAPQPGTSTIHGMVTSQKGEAIPNALVYVLDENEQPISYAVSDENGYYRISGLLAGEYVVQAGNFGYSSAYNGSSKTFNDTEPITVSGEKEINFVLSPNSSTSVDEKKQPRHIRLVGNYPNPFNPETTIIYHTDRSAKVQLDIYNIKGEQINRLVDQTQSAGEYRVVWQGVDHKGEQVASGIYFYRLEIDSFQLHGKMMLLR
ncbi:T9SS type A sorting domain-containing protein [candidate division KSB1 bacterium]|nr:T9SS type A sorting domain-containing protein [candidate division KSB1 bacterium]